MENPMHCMHRALDGTSDPILIRMGAVKHAPNVNAVTKKQQATANNVIMKKICEEKRAHSNIILVGHVVGLATFNGSTLNMVRRYDETGVYSWHRELEKLARRIDVLTLNPFGNKFSNSSVKRGLARYSD